MVALFFLPANLPVAPAKTNHSNKKNPVRFFFFAQKRGDEAEDVVPINTTEQSEQSEQSES